MTLPQMNRTSLIDSDLLKLFGKQLNVVLAIRIS